MVEFGDSNTGQSDPSPQFLKTEVRVDPSANAHPSTIDGIGGHDNSSPGSSGDFDFDLDPSMLAETPPSAASRFSLSTAVPLSGTKFPEDHPIHQLYAEADRAYGTPEWSEAARRALLARYAGHEKFAEKVFQRLERNVGTNRVNLGSGRQVEVCFGIGQGGMGSVLGVWAPGHRMPAQALKYASIEVTGIDATGHWTSQNGGMSERQLAERMHREATVLGKLSDRYNGDSPAPALLGRDTISLRDGKSHPCILMEYCPGNSLQEVFNGIHRQRQEPFSVREATDLVALVCEGLSRVHATGVVSRDLKPSNLVLLDDGRLKVIDFGLAKIVGEEDPLERQWAADAATTGTNILGTLQFLTPEQASGIAVNDKTDVHQIAQVYYYFLTGKHLHATSTSTALEMVTAATTTPARASAELKGLLSKSKEGRELHAALVDALDPAKSQRPSAQQLLRFLLPLSSFATRDPEEFSQEVLAGQHRVSPEFIAFARDSIENSSLSTAVKRGGVDGGRQWVRWAAAGVISTGVLATAVTVASYLRDYRGAPSSSRPSSSQLASADRGHHETFSRRATSDFSLSTDADGSVHGTLFEGLPIELSLDPKRLTAFSVSDANGIRWNVGAKFRFTKEELCALLQCKPSDLERVKNDPEPERIGGKLWVYESMNPKIPGRVLMIEGKVVIVEECNPDGSVKARYYMSQEEHLAAQLDDSGYVPMPNIAHHPVTQAALSRNIPVEYPSTATVETDERMEFESYFRTVQAAWAPELVRQ